MENVAPQIEMNIIKIITLNLKKKIASLHVQNACDETSINNVSCAHVCTQFQTQKIISKKKKKKKKLWEPKTYINIEKEKWLIDEYDSSGKI